MPERSRASLRKIVADLNPEFGLDVERFNAAIARLRPELNRLSESLQTRREKLRGLHSQDIDELVAHTAFVSTLVMGAAILTGLFLSMFFVITSYSIHYTKLYDNGASVTSTRWATPLRAAFSAAMRQASGSMSQANTRCAPSAAAAIARMPEPVPTSRTRAG